MSNGKAFSLFPGCVLESSGAEALQATKLVASSLGMRLVEMDGWACCGASHAQDLESDVSLAVNAHHLAMAERAGFPLLTVCSTCTKILRKARHTLNALSDDELEQKVNRHLRPLGLAYGRTAEVSHILWELDKRLAELKAGHKKDLSSLPVAVFYGCHTVKPAEYLGYESELAPSSMERILSALEIPVVPIKARLDCCGFHALYPAREAALALTSRAVKQAKESGARAIVTPCPLCQMQLDMYQRPGEMPVLHMVQLVGLALGYPPTDLGLQRLLNPLNTAS